MPSNHSEQGILTDDQYSMSEHTQKRTQLRLYIAFRCTLSHPYAPDPIVSSPLLQVACFSFPLRSTSVVRILFQLTDCEILDSYSRCHASAGMCSCLGSGYHMYLHEVSLGAMEISQVSDAFPCPVVDAGMVIEVPSL